MNKLVKASLLLVVLSFLHAKAFANGALDCEFKNESIGGVKTLQLTEEVLFINGKTEIFLEKSKIHCGHRTFSERFDGKDRQYQVVLEACNENDRFEGHLIDTVSKEVAEISCD